MGSFNNATQFHGALSEITSHNDMKLGRVRHNFVFDCDAISATQLRFPLQKTLPNISGQAWPEN